MTVNVGQRESDDLDRIKEERRHRERGAREKMRVNVRERR